MLAMPGEGSPDFASLGRRLRQRVVLSLCLASVLPLLVLAYVIHIHILPDIDALSDVKLFGLQGLLFFTFVAMLVGAWLIWDLGQTVCRMASMLTAQSTPGGLGTRTDEVGTLMNSFTNMVATIEQQATEINTFATRLNSAYKELEVTNTKLKETSFRDEVTGLYNRRFFSLRLEEELSRFKRFNHPVSLVILDIDGFKNVNDEFGHSVGDEVLRELAQILMKHSRGINVVSRFGGDEFAVLLVETSKAGARLYAERIRQVVATFPFLHGKPMTASLGIASLPDDEVTTSEDLFRAADEALYAAKRAGKNQVAAAGPVEKVGR
jgi:diguanylate cyclase (GGDEF)-like protein